MSNDNVEIVRFAENFHQEIIISAEGNQTQEDSGFFREEAFTSLMIEYLIEAGELEDGIVCYHSARGIKVNGYNIQEEEGRLDLFVSIYTQNFPPTTVRKDAVEGAFKQLINFLSKVYKGYHQSIEEASTTFDMAQLIHSQRSQFSHVRLFLFTDGLTTLQTKTSQEVNGVNYSYNIWDLRRTYHSLPCHARIPSRLLCLCCYYYR
jgi:hypothetical protein